MGGRTDWDRERPEFLVRDDEQARRVGTDAGGQNAAFGPLAEQFVQLTRTLLTARTVGGVLQEILVAACRFVPGADLASVTLVGPDGGLHTPIATDPLATELDEVQYRADRGPCVDACNPSGRAFSLHNDLTADGQWPEFSRAATQHGVRAVLATALIRDPFPPRLTGALNLYSRRRDGFDDGDRDIMLLLATHGSLALATTKAVSNAELQTAHLRKAIDSRDVVGQAKGILMHRRGITAEQAFEVLRHASQDLNIKLADLARTVTDRHEELDPLEGGS